MKKRRMPDMKEGGVNVTPLIDIVMCLIIFFMLVAKIGVTSGADGVGLMRTEFLMVGRTTLVSAHRLSTVRALDRLLVFDAGKIVEEGTHAQLVKLNGGIYRRLFERQAGELVKGLEAAE